MNFGFTSGSYEEDGDEAKMVNGWNIQYHGASPICRGIFGVDVSGVFWDIGLTVCRAESGGKSSNVLVW